MKLEQIFGNKVSYKGQKFEIRHDAVSSIGGYYITAIEEGRVRKGDAQWVTKKWLKGALAKAGAFLSEKAAA